MIYCNCNRSYIKKGNKNMKKILALLMALILCISTLSLIACDSDDKDDATTSSSTTATTNPDKDPDDVKLDENHKKYPKTMAIIDLLNEVLNAVPDTDELLTSLPAFSVEDVKVLGMPVDFAVAFNGKDALFVKTEQNAYEYAGNYVLFDGNEIYVVTCESEKEVDVTKVFEELVNGDEGSTIATMLLPFLTGDGIPEDISTLFTDEQLAQFELILNGIPQLSDEYKEDLGNGKYRIKKQYIKDLAQYVVGVINQISGSEDPIEIPEIVWTYFDMITVNVDVTEKDGDVSALDIEIAFGEIFKLTSHTDSEGFELHMSFAYTEIGDEDGTAAGGSSGSFDLEVSDAGVEIEFKLNIDDGNGEKSNVSLDLTADDTKSQGEFKIKVGSDADFTIKFDSEYDAEKAEIGKMNVTLSGTVCTLTVNGVPTDFTNVNASFTYDKSKNGVKDGKLVEFTLVTKDSKTNATGISMSASVAFESENTYSFKYHHYYKNDSSIDVNATLKFGETDGKIPNIKDHFDLDDIAHKGNSVTDSPNY